MNTLLAKEYMSNCILFLSIKNYRYLCLIAYANILLYNNRSSLIYFFNFGLEQRLCLARSKY
jgi:hypothetical protein